MTSPEPAAGRIALGLILLLAPALAASARGDDGFTDGGWNLENAEVVEHLGRQALKGSASLEGVVFENGVIEVDIAMKGGVRGYPGVVFRMQSDEDYERVYVRPHRSPLYGDAVQYVAAFNGVDSWQFYNGPGASAAAPLPTEQWVALRIEVSGSQARVFVGDALQPALLIWELQHGHSQGGIALNTGPTAFFSNFRWRADDELAFNPEPQPFAHPGFLREWELSQPLRRDAVDFESYPDAGQAGATPWTSVSAEDSGLVDISRTFGRSGPAPEAILARAVIRSEREERRRYRFGYSDEVSLFLNGQPIYYGNSAYRSRDGSFLGIVGLFDAVTLPLQEGDNELLLMIGESFGGWGFVVQDAASVFAAADVRKLWTTPRELRIPESAAYDPATDAVYISNYDGYNPSRGTGRQSIARVSLDGTRIEADWLTGVNNPTGLTVHGDRLYAVEPRQVVEIDPKAGTIVARHAVPGAAMLNDIAAAPDGTLYVSDPPKSTLHRLKDGAVEVWLQSPEIVRPNGLHVAGDKLVVAANGDRCLKTVDLVTKEVVPVATLTLGIIDGVKSDNEGNFLVSINEGRLVRVSPEGRVTTLLDTSAVGTNIADFDYIPEKKMLVLPTFVDNRVVAYTLE
jgi:sugar lactone lactonase YvrE